MSLEGAWDQRFGGWQAAHRRSGSIIESMVIDMNEAQVRTLEQLRQVLAGTQAMEFQAAAVDERVGMRGSSRCCAALSTAGYPAQTAAPCWPTCSG